VALGAVAGATLLLRPERALAYAQGHTTFVVVAGAIGLLGTMLAAGLAAATRQTS
jgi:hypothetical protein